MHLAFGILFVLGVVLWFTVGKLIFGIASSNAIEKTHRLREEYIKSITNPELEERLQKRIEDPTQTEAIWKWLEACKEKGNEWIRWEMEGKWAGRHETYRQFRKFNPWVGIVGVERLPFHDQYGNLHPANRQLDQELEAHRYTALLCAMQAYNRTTMTQAKRLAERRYPYPEWIAKVNRWL